MQKPYLSIQEAAEYVGVTRQTLRRWDRSGVFPATLVSPGGHRLYALVDLEVRAKGIVQIAKDWVRSPLAYIPIKEFYCPTRDVFEARLIRMVREMEDQPLLRNIAPLVSSVVGEIGNNSFDHNSGNWPNTPGTFFAYDLGKRIVVLGDRGRGILQTLRQVRPSLNTEEDALHVAFTEVLTGRAPEKRGNGLKYVNKIVERYHFPFLFQSGDAIINVKKENTELHAEVAEIPIHGCLCVMQFNKKL